MVPYKECAARIRRASKANLHSGRGSKHGSEDPSLQGPCTTEVLPSYLDGISVRRRAMTRRISS